ncbi:MAG: flagellar hook-basal body complex protein FliE [Oligoflexia bacterium]|nr:flagellar hook-basal body complex protein FliE [Oligoflexia bacterium]
MPNLTVENLSRSVSTGDVQGLMGMGGGVQPAAAPEAGVIREMQAQGMEVPSVDTASVGGAAGGAAGHPASFSDMLQKSIDQVNTYQHESDQAIKELVSGRTKNIHETMLTIERADTSLKLMMQVRNKALDAYREIMRMQV